MKAYSLALLVAVMLLILPAYAGAAYVPPATVVEDDIKYTIHWDGSYDYEEAVTLRLNTASAVADYGQAYIEENAPDQVRLLNAYTVTPAKQRIDVLPAQILDQPFGNDYDSTFTNAVRKIIIFPALSEGALEHYHYILSANGTFFPGQFFTEENFPVDRSTLLATVTVMAPFVTTLHFSASGLQGGPVPDANPGESAWRYSLINQPAEQPESGSVNVNDFSPRLDITTFGSFTDIANAYEQNADERATVTPAIQQLSDRITAGITDPEAQARALYNWVAQNIRYVAVDLGYSGYVPDYAQAVLETGYGDCKDHVILLQALLAAKHIASSGALVNADDEYFAPQIAVPDFDHIITYIPRFNLFLDSTAEFAPFGVLPSLERGKQALITGAPGIAPRLVTIPLTGPVPDRVLITTHAALAATGAVSGTLNVQGSGFHEMNDRGFFVALDDDDQYQNLPALLEDYGEQGDASLATQDDPTDLSKQFQFSASFTLPYDARLPGPGTLPIPLGAPDALQSYLRTTILPYRKRPVPCPAESIEEQTYLSLPAGFTVKSLPQTVDFRNSIGSYQASYHLQGGTLIADRRLISHPAGATCDSSDYAQLRALNFAVGQDLRSAISY